MQYVCNMEGFADWPVMWMYHKRIWMQYVRNTEGFACNNYVTWKHLHTNVSNIEGFACNMYATWKDLHASCM